MAVFLPQVLFVFLLLPSSALSTANLTYINCGSSRGFTDETNITWVGDEQFVKSGESRAIHEGPNNGTTLRAFPRNKKNCYTIPVVRDNKVQVRVGFHYGNYDGKGKPPTFKLIFDGADWSTVNLSASREAVVSYTAIYVARSDNTNVCFGRLYEDQDPIVYYIQLSLLGKGMYPSVNSSYALSRPKRYAFDANQTIIRHPDDKYDRIWYSDNYYTTLNISDSAIKISKYQKFNVVSSNVSTDSCTDDPPAKIFRNAITPTNRKRGQGRSNLTITTSFLFPDPMQIYFNMYFTEPWNLTAAKKKKNRSFQVYMGSERINSSNAPPSNGSDAIVPQWGKALEFTAIIPNATNNTSFSLVPTSSSSYDPVVSGFEVLLLSSFSQQSTSLSDVNGLAALQGSFTVLQSWTGDPCLPANFTWEWVECSSDDAPRIESISLSSYGLNGSLPDFSNLDALQNIDFHNNSLTGRIPEFLTRLPRLRSLNLAYNNFSYIPPVLLSLAENKTISLNITGNDLLITTPSNTSKCGRLHGRLAE